MKIGAGRFLLRGRGGVMFARQCGRTFYAISSIPIAVEGVRHSPNGGLEMVWGCDGEAQNEKADKDRKLAEDSISNKVKQSARLSSSECSLSEHDPRKCCRYSVSRLTSTLIGDLPGNS